MSTLKKPTDTFSRILCLVDGSEAGCRAAMRSAHLAKALGAELNFLAVGTEHIRDEGFEEYARVEGVSTPMPSDYEPRTLDCLNIASAIARETGVEYAAQIEATGDVVAAICSNAMAYGVDVVVLRRQKFGLLDWMLGTSVSDRVTKDCSFAILSIR